MADKKKAIETYQAALKYQARFPVFHSPLGLVAKPEFNVYRLATVEHLLDCSLTKEQIVAKLATPIQWVCDAKYVNSAEQAIELANRARSQRQNQAAANATKTSDIHRWPKLIGTPNQIAWADNIRGKLAKKVPGSPHLKSVNSAKWWIENRNVL